MSDLALWRVAVKAPLPQLLTYSSDLPLIRGQKVLVPLGKRSADGVVIDREMQAPTDFQLKSILSIEEEFPPLSPQQLQWALWVAKYYHHSPGDVFSLFYPPLAKKGRNPAKDLFTKSVQEKKVTLNAEQQHAVDTIDAIKGFSTHLLWGVTGSGKTEVYIELIKRKLAEQKGSIVLVPEIALTPQLISRFREQLGDEMAVLHSDLTDREKTNQWWSVVDQKKRVLIGARSALFCPMPDLGLIIIDEEHEASYKQDESLRYHARDAAIVRAQHEKVPIVLGSATPSLETWKNVTDKKFHLHQLKHRAMTLHMPEIKIINMQDSKHDLSRESFLPFWMSAELHRELQTNYQNGFQSALFLNRRGIAQTVFCNDCGFLYKCPNCDISLTLHGHSHLVCHYCDYSQELSKTCPECKMGSVKPSGLGTELVQEDLQKLFPHSKVLRVDRDEIDSRARLEEFIEQMEQGDVQFLVGTQMIAKGLDFKKLTLVGIVLADISFHIPDFRAAERSYQLITQVSGRSGRHHPGKVLIQTYKPDHPSLTHALTADTAGFLNQELEERTGLHYPPFGRLACIKLSGTLQNKTEPQTQELAQNLREYILNKNLPVRLLGPAPAPLFKLRNRYRYQILLKSESLPAVHEVLQYATHLQTSYRALKIQIDMDPYNLM